MSVTERLIRRVLQDILDYHEVHALLDVEDVWEIAEVYRAVTAGFNAREIRTRDDLQDVAYEHMLREWTLCDVCLAETDGLHPSCREHFDADYWRGD